MQLLYLPHEFVAFKIIMLIYSRALFKKSVSLRAHITANKVTLERRNNDD